MPLDGYREWHIGRGQCVLCAALNVVTFDFEDNERWSEESICRDCLWEALRIVNEAILKEEQKQQ